MNDDLSENARRVLDARYLGRDAQRRIVETPAQLFERVTCAVAEGERSAGRDAEPARWRDEFHRVLSALDFLPNSPTLMNAGTLLGQLSACFVLPVDDTMESIFEALKQMALLQRTGGGTGRVQWDSLTCDASLAFDADQRHEPRDPAR